MAMTFTPPPLAAAAAAGPPGPDAPPTPEASLGANEGGEERTERVLSGIELRGRILGNCLMNASTCGTVREVPYQVSGKPLVYVLFWLHPLTTRWRTAAAFVKMC